MVNNRWGWVLLAGLGMVLPAGAQVEEYIRFIEADRLILSSIGKLVWKADAASSPSHTSSIWLAPVDVLPRTGGERLLPRPSTSTPAEYSIPGAIAMSSGDYEVRYFTAGGHVSGLSESGWGGRRANVADPARITAFSQLEVSGSRTFVTDETGEFLDQGRLWALNDYVGGPALTPDLVADYSSGPDATWFRSLVAVHSGNVLALMGSRRLSRFLSIPAPPLDHIWLEFQEASNVLAMVRHKRPTSEGGDRLVWVTMNAANTHITFYSAPLTNLANAVLLGTEPTPTASPFDAIAVSDAHVYYQIAGAGPGGALRRRSAFYFDAASDEVATLDHEVRQICANDRFVFWLRNGNTIMRLPVGAAAITRNLAITGMEVIQAIQSPSNDVPLVAQKPTQVRVLARLLSSSAGETSLSLGSTMLLHGFRGGVALPGSPIPAGAALGFTPPVTTNQPDRNDPAQGYWFRLPESWTAAGATELRAELNPARVYRETNYADNVASRLATFTQKVPIGIKVIPAWTHFGTIDRRHSDHRQIWEQAALLLPTSSLRVEYPRTPRIEERIGVFSATDPYEFMPADDDKDSVLHALFWRKVEGAGGTLAEPGGFDHYLAMIPAAALFIPLNGYASVGDDISITHAALLLRHDLAYNAHGTRSRAISLAHELAHNYGRGHVDGCGGNPAGPDSSYPFADGWISDAAAGHLGFNPYLRKLLPLIGTGDMMTYCGDRWISSYNWKKLFNRVGSGYGPTALATPSSPPAPASLNTRGLVGGIINLTNGTSTIRPVFDLGADAWDRATANVGPPGATYQLRAYEGADLKASYPVGELYADADADAGVPQTHRAWVAALGDLTGVDSIRLVSLQNPAVPLVTVNGGETAPTVTVHKPEAGPVLTDTLNIEWTSTDDGPGPLSHIVRISPDNGATWRVLASEFLGSQMTAPVADLPGGATCRVEVVASDGILCGRGLSGEFQLPNHAPDAQIFFENEDRFVTTPLNTAKFAYGERIVLHAEVSDVEDGWLPESSVTWTVSGPLAVAGAGRRFEPGVLPSGSYMVQLQATDSLGASTIDMATLIVRSSHLPSVSSPIELDGYADEVGYAADRWPRWIAYPGTSGCARVVWVRDADRICIAAYGLLPGTNANHRFVFGIDAGGFPSDPPGPASQLFEVLKTGTLNWFRGDGSGWVLVSNAQGVAASVIDDGNRWNVELCLDVSVLPENAMDQPAWVFAGVRDRRFPGDDAGYPAGASPEAPSSWMASFLGSDPELPDDADQDGMPDAWEKDAFGPGGSSAGVDTDLDTASDADEYVSGTDPNSPTSLLIVRNYDGYQLSWPGALDRTYSVWRGTDAGHLEEVAEGIGAPTFGDLFWWDVAPPDDTVFYRVRAHFYR